MVEQRFGPDQRTLAQHLQSIGFQAGVEEGRWSVLVDSFPELVVRVTGLDFSGRISATMEFQLLCDDYPVLGPFVQHWDQASKQRPTPPTAAEAPPGVVDALKTWSRDDGLGYGGIYRPWQRYAAIHNGWAALRPEEAWHRNSDLTFIMEKLYGLVSDQAAWLAVRAAA